MVVRCGGVREGNQCHPERSEGPGRAVARRSSFVPPSSQVPRYARDDRKTSGRELDRGQDLVPMAAILDGGKAQRPGHDDSAAVRVEHALRADLEEALPVEAAAGIADDEADLVVIALVTQ